MCYTWWRRPQISSNPAGTLRPDCVERMPIFFQSSFTCAAIFRLTRGYSMSVAATVLWLSSSPSEAIRWWESILPMPAFGLHGRAVLRADLKSWRQTEAPLRTWPRRLLIWFTVRRLWSTCMIPEVSWRDVTRRRSLKADSFAQPRITATGRIWRYHLPMDGTNTPIRCLMEVI